MSKTYTIPHPIEKRLDAIRSRDVHNAAELLKKIGSGNFTKRDIAMASIIGPQLEKREAVIS